eukprot:3035667-Rhodomonas_salina.1
MAVFFARNHQPIPQERAELKLGHRRERKASQTVRFRRGVLCFCELSHVLQKLAELLHAGVARREVVDQPLDFAQMAHGCGDGSGREGGHVH